MKNDKNNDETDKETERQRTSQVESSIFEKVMPGGIKRGLETLLRDGRLKSVIGDLKLPKEIVNHILSQVDETKHSALGVVSREVRLFLERTNLSDELAKLLTQISFEVTTNVRFVPSDKALAKQECDEDSPSSEDDTQDSES